MKEISATEASRGFAELLDAVEHGGESFLIRRKGRAIARIEPATGASGRAVKDLLATAPHDPGWAGELEALRAALPAEVPNWDE